MRISTVVGVLVAVLVGVTIGALGAWAVGLTNAPEVQVLEGYASVNQEGTAIGLSPDGQVPGPGYVVAGAMWREQDGPWRDTFPTCLEPLAAGQRVRLGVVQVRPQGQAPGRAVVVWLECLE